MARRTRENPIAWIATRLAVGVVVAVSASTIIDLLTLLKTRL